MNKQSSRLLCTVLSALAVVLAGCAWMVEVHMLNGTSKEVIIVSVDPKLSETQYIVRAGERVRIRTPYKLRVQYGTNEWTYDLPAVPPPKAFRKRVGVNKYMVAYAVREDGLLVMLRPGSTNAVADSEEQPKGYPVRPQ
jgi:hypothetical protein